MARLEPKPSTRLWGLLALALAAGCAGEVADGARPADPDAATGDTASDVTGDVREDVGADAPPGEDVFADACGPAVEPTCEDEGDLDVGADADIDVARTCGCFEAEGTWCFDRAAALAEAEGCELPTGEPGDLLSCADGQWSVADRCEAACEQGEVGGTDVCGLPLCDCFVRVAWCGASAARHALTLDPPCQIPLVPEHDQDILACDGPTWIVREVCEMGCYEAPTGTPDACLGTRTTENPGWADCPHRDLIASGVHPEASDRLRCAGITADRITQTIGSAAASAGYHAADGTVDGRAYTAAIDLRARDLTEAQIRDQLVRLGENGFAAWYRKPGADGWPSDQAPHIHAVFAGVVMKSQLRGQVRDFLIGLNGLASHTRYRFWSPSAEILEIVRLLFSRHYTP